GDGPEGFVAGGPPQGPADAVRRPRRPSPPGCRRSSPHPSFLFRPLPFALPSAFSPIGSGAGGAPACCSAAGFLRPPSLRLLLAGLGTAGPSPPASAPGAAGAPGKGARPTPA